MITGHRKFGVQLLATIVGLLALGLGSGCGRKCNTPVTTPFRFLRETQWRLVETSNPAPEYRSLGKYTFFIWQFRQNFTGDIFQVVNNDQRDSPFRTFKWNTDGNKSGNLAMKFSEPGTADPGGGEGGGTEARDLGTFQFSFNLSNELNITDLQRGHEYRFVPFQGVVDPDNDCSF